MSAVPELHTPRARLREVRLEDAEALLDVYGHPDGVRFLGRPVQTLEQVQTRLTRMREDVSRNEAAFWVMTDPGADRALAYLGFFRWDVPHQTAELGYVLAPSRWGQGLMREVLPVLVRHGFEAIGLHRMEARIDPGNVPSIPPGRAPRVPAGGAAPRPDAQRGRDPRGPPPLRPAPPRVRSSRPSLSRRGVAGRAHRCHLTEGGRRAASRGWFG